MSHKKKHKPVLLILLLVALAGLSAALMWGTNVAVLNPKGSVAQEQFDLIVFTSLLSLIVIIPVFTLTFYIAWKYREGNTKAKYRPDWDRNRLLESIWWLIPMALITVLAVIAWKTSHSLDPFKPIESDKKPLTVQVVALQWKWLFIYPEQDIATVNYVRFPVDTPINFEITSDAPMNSFWIPQLGGQIYAMSGMKTKLHLMADAAGEYAGSSANISGSGFAGMKFTAIASPQASFNRWVKTVKASPDRLDSRAYEELAEPSQDNPVAYYSSKDDSLYDTVIMKYMTPGMRSTGHGQDGH
jgi:cytochrome o ubiquinol oxidase subunit II